MKQATNFASTVLAMVIAALIVICLICSLCFGSLFLLSASSSKSLSSSAAKSKFSYEAVYGDKNENKLLSITLAGPILTDKQTDGTGFSLFGDSGYVYGYQVKEELRRAADEETIKGVILEINSPGGTITGAKAISDGVAYYREKTGNPVYAHIRGVGASGAYWSAAATDFIIADSGSVSGSIGVIYGPFKFYDKVLEEGSLLTGSVVTQNGIETTYFTAGEFKDNGSPYRRLTKTETDLIQQSVNNEYEGFVNFVSQRRKISVEKIKTNVKALAYDNKQAKDLGLIDAEGSKEDAYDQLAKKAGLGDNDYQVVREAKALGFWGQIFSVTGFDKVFNVNGNAGNDDQAVSGSQTGSQSQQSQTECKLCAQPLYFYGNPQMAL